MSQRSFEEEWSVVKDLVRMITESLTNNGNYKKMNCKNFERSFCLAWTWDSKPRFSFQMDEPLKKGDAWHINPHPFLCAICPKWKQVKEELEKPKRAEIVLEKRIEKFAKDANVTINQLKQIFDFEEDNLTLLVEVSGKNEAEKQLRATLLILTGFSHCYEKEEVLSADLRKKLEDLGIRSLVNLATNLAKHRQFILLRGEPKSPKFRYKITVPGKREGLRIIRELAGGSKVKATQEIESA